MGVSTESDKLRIWITSLLLSFPDGTGGGIDLVVLMELQLARVLGVGLAGAGGGKQRPTLWKPT